MHVVIAIIIIIIFKDEPRLASFTGAKDGRWW